MEEITNSKKRKREIRNEKLRKARQVKFEKRQRVEKISQFRPIADLQNNLRKEMYELANIAHRQYSRTKWLPKQISLTYYHHQPPVHKYKQSTPSL